MYNLSTYVLYLQRYPHLNASKHYLKVVKLALNGLLNNPLGNKLFQPPTI